MEESGGTLGISTAVGRSRGREGRAARGGLTQEASLAQEYRKRVPHRRGAGGTSAREPAVGRRGRQSRSAGWYLEGASAYGTRDPRHSGSGIHQHRDEPSGGGRD